MRFRPALLSVIRQVAPVEPKPLILNYHRIAEEGRSEDEPTIVLLTVYKNQAAYDERQKLFDSFVKQLPGNSAGKVVLWSHEDLYETVSTRVYNDYTEPHTARFRLLAKN